MKKKIDPVKVEEALNNLGIKKKRGWLLSPKGQSRAKRGPGKS
jgi:hypothetical protein